jgi:hypothetical protein
LSAVSPEAIKKVPVVWRALQGTAAATIAWRGQNAVRLVVGVFLGIAVGEATVAIFGGYGGMAVVAEEPGIYRALDALIGAGVALVFSQALFSPQPLALLRRAVDRLRDLRDQLAELSRVRGASSRVARRSAVWRSQRAPVVRENESAGHLDLLAGSSLSFARAALGASAAARAWLVPSAGELAAALSELARQPGDRVVRQRAADRALEVARRLQTAHRAPDPSLLTAVATGRMVAADVMAFAGVDPDQVAAALREDSDDIDVATPPPMPKHPFGLPARRPAKGGLLPTVRRMAGALRRRLRAGT